MYVCLYKRIKGSLTIQCGSFSSQRGKELYTVQMWPDQHYTGRPKPETRLGRGERVSAVLLCCVSLCFMLASCIQSCLSLCSDSDWDFNWCDVGWLRENFDHSYMEEHVRVCHFRNHYEVGSIQIMQIIIDYNWMCTENMHELCVFFFSWPVRTWW